MSSTTGFKAANITFAVMIAALTALIAQYFSGSYRIELSQKFGGKDEPKRIQTGPRRRKSPSIW
jgi:hypothetical protein